MRRTVLLLSGLDEENEITRSQDPSRSCADVGGPLRGGCPFLSLWGWLTRAPQVVIVTSYGRESYLSLLEGTTVVAPTESQLGSYYDHGVY